MSAVKIKVKPYHIGRGQMSDSEACPIALAARKQLGLVDVSVDVDELTGTTKSGDSVSYRLSRAANRFIKRFDDLGSKGVRAFNFFAFPK